MIKLENVVVHSYKCIGAGQSFKAGTGITALIGRNEAGKTSVLEALAKANYFNRQEKRFIYNDIYDYPRQKKREMEKAKGIPPVVTLTYRVDSKLADKIECEMLLPPKNSLFSRTTDYKGVSRVLENGFEYSVDGFLSAYAEKKDAAIGKFIRLLSGVRTREEFNRFLNRIEQEADGEEMDALKRLEPYFQNKHGWENPLNEYVYRVYLLPNIPKFLYYDEYFMLPSRVSIDRLAGNTELTDSERTAKALLMLADFDVDKMFQSREFERYKSELEIIQAEFTADFLKYWTSNKELLIEFELIQEEKKEKPDGTKKGFFSWMKGGKPKKEYETFLEIRVRDKKNMVSLPLGNRSRGFNGFFSFWVWFKAIQKERACPFVLLLDEPGTNLHAGVQKDLMNLMKDISEQDQIIFTTHSPYMLEEVKESIYCIVDREGGSIIRPFSAETDEETLAPLRW